MTEFDRYDKVFVLALDGATFDLILPWAHEGLLPVFSQLMGQFAWGQLTSTIPPITPTAWMTFMTGRNPGVHGVFDFFQRATHSYTDLVPSTTSLNHHPTLWEILGRRGHKVGVINVPMTYPPVSVNGFLVSGVPIPQNASAYSYPEDLVSQLAARQWDLTRDASYQIGSFETFYDYLRDLMVTRTSATLALMKDHEWDFFMVHYLEIDQAQHTYWRVMESGHPESLKDAIFGLYQLAESIIEQIRESLPERTLLVILSDHGMGPTRYHVNPNNWLLQEGLMYWKSRPGTWFRRSAYRIGLSPLDVYHRLPGNLALGELRADVAQMPVKSVGFRRRALRHIMALPVLDFSDIDWARTKCYSAGTTQAGLININLKGRERNGIVTPGQEYETLRDRLIDRLAQWQDPCTGRELVKRAWRREELYSGDQVPDAPDVIVEYNWPEYDTKKGQTFFSTHTVERVRNVNATHRPNGILLMVGDQVVPGKLLSNVSLIDVPATILWSLGESVPADWEGKVTDQAFAFQRDAVRENREWGLDIVEKEPLTSEEARAITERLRGLGYVE